MAAVAADHFQLERSWGLTRQVPPPGDTSGRNAGTPADPILEEEPNPGVGGVVVGRDREVPLHPRWLVQALQYIERTLPPLIAGVAPDGDGGWMDLRNLPDNRTLSRPVFCGCGERATWLARTRRCPFASSRRP